MNIEIWKSVSVRIYHLSGVAIHGSSDQLIQNTVIKYHTTYSGQISRFLVFSIQPGKKKILKFQVKHSNEMTITSPVSVKMCTKLNPTKENHIFKPLVGYNNSPPYVTARWRPQEIPPLNFLGAISKSKLSTLFWKVIYASWNKSFKELKNGIEILAGQAVFNVMDQNSQNIALVNNSRTA